MTGGTASSIIQLLHRSLPAQSSSVFSSTTIHCFCTLCNENLINHWIHRQVSFCTTLLYGDLKIYTTFGIYTIIFGLTQLGIDNPQPRLSSVGG